MKKGKNKTLAVDFDSVIHYYGSGFKNGDIYDDPVPGAKEALEQLIKDGYIILIYSTRCNKEYWGKNDPNRIEQVKEYLKKHEIPYSKIHTGGKPKCHIYIDDRAISFKGDWNQTLSDIDNFKTWNRPDAKSSAEIEFENENKKS